MLCTCQTTNPTVKKLNKWTLTNQFFVFVAIITDSREKKYFFLFCEVC